MKRIFIILTLLSIILPAGAQHEIGSDYIRQDRRPSPCDTKTQIADSLISFSFNATSETFTPVSVLLYSYDNNMNLIQVISKYLPGRTNNFRQIFEYDHNDLLTKYIYQVWSVNEWKDNLINERTYSPDGLPETEVFIRENSEGVFVAYQRHFYTQEEGRITSYLRQVKNADGDWYDFSNHFYVYDEAGQLKVLYGQYVNDGPVFWERTAIFNAEGKVSERYLKVLHYDYSLKRNVLTNELYQVYSYNEYGNVVEIRHNSFADNNWYFTGVDSTYYSMLKNKKVSICHNGHSICVSINALDAHLAHGDKIGPCNEEKDPPGKDCDNPGHSSSPKKHFTIYPNPATDHLTILLNEKENKFTSGYILTSEGRRVKSFSVNGESEIHINVSQLIPGNYLVSLFGKIGTESQVFVKKY